MKDKLQIIKEEIERIEQILDDFNKTHNNTIDNGIVSAKKNICEHIKSFIDSLPEEPKCIYNRTLDERKKFCKYCSAACVARTEEEPVSDDLEEEKENYNERYKRIAQTEQFKKSYYDKSLGKEEFASDDLEEEILCRWEDDPHTLWPKCPYSDFRNISRHFAEWQKQKDFEELLKSDMSKFKECYEKGRFDMREEMMKDAVQGWCINDGRILNDIRTIETEKTNLKKGDKLKIIIVKHEHNEQDC